MKVTLVALGPCSLKEGSWSPFPLLLSRDWMWAQDWELPSIWKPHDEDDRAMGRQTNGVRLPC